MTNLLATLTLILTATLLGDPAAALANTPGPVCRQACAPRIARDCGAPGVRGFRKCKRSLVRACKQTSPETACALDADAAPGADGANPGGPSGGRDDRPGAGGGRAAQVTAALADKLVRAGSEQFFSSGSITTTNDMTLCGSGRMQLVVTTVTSTFSADFSNTFDSTETFDGTWSVRVESGATVLELATGEPQPRRFAVEVDASGAVVIDGRTASVDDATGACGATDSGGQTPGTPTTPPATDDLAARITSALADQFLSIEETNLGFGRRVTAIVLCASGRYALELNASVIPGVEVSTSGDWTVRVDGATATLELGGTGSQPTRTFTIGADAQGNLLLNDLPAQSGDPGLVGQVCPSL